MKLFIQKCIFSLVAIATVSACGDTKNGSSVSKNSSSENSEKKEDGQNTDVFCRYGRNPIDGLTSSEDLNLSIKTPQNIKVFICESQEECEKIDGVTHVSGRQTSPDADLVWTGYKKAESVTQEFDMPGARVGEKVEISVTPNAMFELPKKVKAGDILDVNNVYWAFNLSAKMTGIDYMYGAATVSGDGAIKGLQFSNLKYTKYNEKREAEFTDFYACTYRTKI